MKITLEEWQRRYRRMRDIAERIDRMRTDRAFALALSVGIPRHMCCLHNASIDEGMTGWCHGNRYRLRVAKHAIRILSTCGEPYRVLDRWDARVREYVL